MIGIVVCHKFYSIVLEVIERGNLPASNRHCTLAIVNPKLRLCLFMLVDIFIFKLVVINMVVVVWSVYFTHKYAWIVTCDARWSLAERVLRKTECR